MTTFTSTDNAAAFARLAALMEASQPAGCTFMLYTSEYSRNGDTHISLTVRSTTGDEHKIKVVAATMREAIDEAYARYRKFTSVMPAFNPGIAIEHQPSDAGNESF